MSQAAFQDGSDYLVPLLRLMAEQPNSECRRYDALNDFYTRYVDRIAESELAPGPGSGERAIWYSMTKKACSKLIDLGLMTRPRSRFWAITEEGRDWLVAHPDATHVDNIPQKRGDTSPGSSNGREKENTTNTGGITPAMLEETRTSMQPEDFRRVWGPLYEQLLADERSQRTTDLSDADLLTAARPNSAHSRLSARTRKRTTLIGRIV